MKGIKLTHDEFISILKNRGILDEFELLSTYENDNTRINLLHKKSKCRFNLKAGNLKRGSRILTIVSCIDKTDYYKYLVSKINPNIEIIGEYINENVKILIKYNNEFYSVFPRHLYTNHVPKNLAFNNKTDVFIRCAIKVHGDKYDYSLINYNKWDDFITVICKKHGKFKIKASEFVSNSTKRGCQKCSKEKCITGWGKTSWYNCGNRSKKFDSYKVYIIECYNEYEKFVKIGRTFMTLKNRFDARSNLPYKYNIIRIITGTHLEMYDLENKLIRKFKQHKYTPNIKFSGACECFNINIKDLI